MIPIFITSRSYPRAPPPTVRLIEPLKEQIRRQVDGSDGVFNRTGREMLWEAGYRNSSQMAALLADNVAKRGVMLHPVVAHAIEQMEKTELIEEIEQDNRIAKIAGIEEIRRPRLWMVAGTVSIALVLAPLANLDNIKFLFPLAIAGLVSFGITALGYLFSFASSFGAGRSASFVLIDRVYEFLLHRENQEALAAKLANGNTEK